METEVGKIATLLKTTSEKKTPLQVNLDNFGRKLSILILVFCGILFGISVVRGEAIGEAFLFAVALAVAAIPEALSSIVTIVLSFGTQKMAREHAIIRKPAGCRGPRQRVRHMLGQDGYSYAEQDDGSRATMYTDERSMRKTWIQMMKKRVSS